MPPLDTARSWWGALQQPPIFDKHPEMRPSFFIHNHSSPCQPMTTERDLGKRESLSLSYFASKQSIFQPHDFPKKQTSEFEMLCILPFSLHPLLSLFLRLIFEVRMPGTPWEEEEEHQEKQLQHPAKAAHGSSYIKGNCERSAKRKQSSHQAMTVVHHRVINQGVSSTPRSSSLPHLYNIMEQDKTTLQS